MAFWRLGFHVLNDQETIMCFECPFCGLISHEVKSVCPYCGEQIQTSNYLGVLKSEAPHI